jgi:predicted transcriptional regulator
MSAVRQKFSSQADPRLLGELRAIAHEEGRQFQAVLEQAVREFVERKRSATPRAQVMAHFQASVEKNRRLGELLAR